MSDLVNIVNKAEALLSVISTGKKELSPRYGLIVADDEIHIAVPHGAQRVRTYSNIVEVEYPNDRVMRIPLPMNISGWHIKAYSLGNTTRVEIARYVKVKKQAQSTDTDKAKVVRPSKQKPSKPKKTMKKEETVKKEEKTEEVEE